MTGQRFAKKWAANQRKISSLSWDTSAQKLWHIFWQKFWHFFWLYRLISASKTRTRIPSIFLREELQTSALCALGQSYAACGRGAGCSHNNQCSSPHQPGWPRSLRSQRPACLALPKWCNHKSRGSVADLCSQVARVPSKAGLARFARSGPPCWWVRAFGPNS